MSNPVNPPAKPARRDPREIVFPSGSLDAKMDELARSIPASELDKIPTDLSRNHDKYGGRNG